METPSSSSPSHPPPDQNPGAGELGAVGRIADRIAPGLNDQLTLIAGRVAMLLSRPTADAEAHRALLEINAAAEKAIEVIRHLQLLSNRCVIQRQPQNLNALVNHLLPEVRRTLGEACELEVRLDPALPWVEGDAQKLEWVVLNLARHAASAPAGCGQLVLTSSAITLDGADAGGHEQGRPGNYVVLGIGYAGTLTPAQVEQLSGPGLPLGPDDPGADVSLATVFATVRQHAGWLNVDTRRRDRVQIDVYLPAASARPLSAPAPAVEGRGGETILLVDDDALVREFTTALLKQRGYRVLQAGTADEAREAWHWHRQRIKLLIADVALQGGASGPQIARAFRAEKPELALIIVSGHGVDILEQSPLQPSEYLFLQKPWTPDALARLVRTAIDSHLL